jgi:ketosteroid isomerase-like protein
MSATNVQAVNDIYAAFGRGDIPFIMGKLTDDVQWHTHLESNVPWAGDYSTKGRIPGFFNAIFASVDVLGFEPQEMMAVDDTVVSMGTFACRSKETGKETNTRWIFVWKFKDGLISSYEQFHDPVISSIFPRD